MHTCDRLVRLSLLLLLACTLFAIRPASAAFLSLQFIDTAGAGTPSNQSGFTEWNLSAYNANVAGPASNTFTGITDPGVPGGSVSVYLAQGASFNASGIVTGTGNLAARQRSPGYGGTYGGLYSGVLFAQATSATTLTLEMTGLVPTDSYDLTLFAGDQQQIGTAAFAGNVNGTTGSTTTGSESWTTSNPSSLTSYSSTLVLTPNSNGQITVNATVPSGGSTQQGFLNGLQISDAPEPASIGMALCAAAGLAILRRRRPA